MKALQGAYRIEDLCEAFEVSRSGYHRWRQAKQSERARKDAELCEDLKQLHEQSRRTYGRPRLTHALRQKGKHCSSKRVGRLMKSLGLKGVRRGRYRVQTTQSDHSCRAAANRMGEMEAPQAPDQIWVADITYVATEEGWLYVAAVLDRFSRRVLGLAMSARLDSELTQAALLQALCRRRKAKTKAVLHHSDRGLQYANERYQTLLRENKLEASMSRKANCYDNAHMESFWGTLKAELLKGRRYASRAEARLSIFEYVEVFYNRERLHSALGYQSPVDFETQLN